MRALLSMQCSMLLLHDVNAMLRKRDGCKSSHAVWLASEECSKPQAKPQAKRKKKKEKKKFFFFFFSCRIDALASRWRCFATRASCAKSIASSRKSCEASREHRIASSHQMLYRSRPDDACQASRIASPPQSIDASQGTRDALQASCSRRQCLHRIASDA